MMNFFYFIFFFFALVFSSENDNSTMTIYEALNFKDYTVTLWINQNGNYSLMLEFERNNIMISTGNYVKDENAIFLHKSNYQSIQWPLDLKFLTDPCPGKILTIFVNTLFWYSTSSKLYCKCLKFPSKIFPLNFIKNFFIWFYTNFPISNFVRFATPLLWLIIFIFLDVNYLKLENFKVQSSKVFFWFMIFSLVDFFMPIILFMFLHILVVMPFLIFLWFIENQIIETNFISFLAYQPFFAMSLQMSIFVYNLNIPKNVGYPPSFQQMNTTLGILLKYINKKSVFKIFTLFLPFLLLHLLQYTFCSYFYSEKSNNWLNAFSKELVLPNSHLWPKTHLVSNINK